LIGSWGGRWLSQNSPWWPEALPPKGSQKFQCCQRRGWFYNVLYWTRLSLGFHAGWTCATTSQWREWTWESKCPLDEVRKACQKRGAGPSLRSAFQVMEARERYKEHPWYGHGPHRLWAPDLFKIATGLTARPARKATGRYPNDNPLASLSRPPSYMSRHVHMSKKIHMFRVNKSHRNVIPLLADYHKPHHLVPTKSIAQLACWPSSAPPRQPSFWTLGITPPYLPRLQDFIQCLQYQAYWSC
jgi:hypothetical protein